jgi:RNA polymerase sigma factor (sigma-70 family)
MDDDRRAAERAEDAALVARARGEDPDAFGRLYDRWFTRVHDLAFRITHDDAAASDVSQDAFVSAWKNLDRLENPEAFGGWMLRIARNAALDRKRKDAKATPFDDEGLAMIESAGPSPASAPAGFRVEDRTRTAEDPAHAIEDNELVALVWESAAALGDRDAEILDLGLRHGLTPAEIGEAVGMNRNAANQAVHRARNRLKTAVEARVLWRSGEPVCEGLAAALTTAKVGHFGPEAVRVTTRHAEKCAECQERRQTRLEPSAMFGALPFLVVPMLLKMKVAHALSESGVPMAGSDTVTGSDPDAPSDGRPPRRRHVGRKGLVVAGIVAVVAVVGVGAFADEVDEVKVAISDAPSVTTTTGEDTTTSTAPVVPPTDVPSTTTATTKPFVPPPPPPPPVTSPPPPPETGTASISVTPGRAPTFYLVQWSSTGGVRWSVAGPGLSDTNPSGAKTIQSRPTLQYRIVVYGSSGQVLAQQTATAP